MCNCTKGMQDLAPFILRLATGAVFAMHGYQKLTTMGVPGVSGFLGGLGFPAADLFAVILIAVELVGGLMLIFGAFTHWVSKLMVIISVVALLLVHIGNGFFVSDGGYEFILLLLAASISLMITGGGRWSLDKTLLKR